MPATSSPQYEGAIYHVYQRGNNRDYIFNDQLTCISKSQVPMEDLLKQIGGFLNISESAVCKFLSRYNQKNG